MDILFSRSWIFKGIPMCVILELLPPDDVCWQTQSSRKRSVSFSFNRLAGISCNGSFLSTLWHGEGYNGSSARSAANGWFCQWAGEVFLTSIPSTSHSPCYAATHGHIFHHIGWNTWSCNNSHILPVVACAGGGFFPSKWFFLLIPQGGFSEQCCKAWCCRAGPMGGRRAIACLHWTNRMIMMSSPP